MLRRDHHRLRLDERNRKRHPQRHFEIRTLTRGGRNSRICPWGGHPKFRPLRPSSADEYLKACYRSR